ncbi:MAG: hypothetical protein WCX31_20175 [Salinivirgaceae bacterium]
MKSSLFLLFSLIFIVNAMSQNCDDFYLRNCEGMGKPYKISGQSRDATFEKGQTSVFHLTVYKNFEYSIQICSDKNLKDIYFKIKEDNVTQEVLYDSSVEDSKYLQKEFLSLKTRKLIIEVTVPEGEMEASQEDYDKRVGCVGVLVEYNLPVKKGFE